MPSPIAPPRSSYRRRAGVALVRGPFLALLIAGSLGAPALRATTLPPASSQASASTVPAADAAHEALPPPIATALARAELAPDALGLWVQAVDDATPLVRWNADRPMNPASVFKLATTAAALDLL